MKTKRIVQTAIVIPVVSAAAFGVLALPEYRERARIGAAYGARVACSCRYVSGRTLAACRRDFEPGMAPIVLSEDSSTRTITARFPILASGRARFDDGWGCRMVP